MGHLYPSPGWTNASTSVPNYLAPPANPEFLASILPAFAAILGRSILLCRIQRINVSSDGSRQNRRIEGEHPPGGERYLLEEFLIAGHICAMRRVKTQNVSHAATVVNDGKQV